jgi:hypothetical protein
MMRLAGVLLALALLGSLLAGTRAPYAVHAPDAAAIRLAWRALGEAALHCRTPSEAEQAGLPAHMRRKQICERRLPTFRLRVAIDGADVLDESIVPAGAAGDRAAVVLRELPVAPGAHRLEIEFAAENEAPPADAASLVRPKRLATDVTLAPGEILLVMEDPATRELIVHATRR